jgi:hypothetical protein
LLFQPSTNGIDVFDGRLGALRTRISLPTALSQNYDALVSDGKDNRLIAITGETGNGIAIIDLSSLAEPSPLAYQDTASNARLSTDRIQPIPSRPAISNTSHASTNLGTVPKATIRHVSNVFAFPKS